MSEFIGWNSQPLDAWAEKYAQGSFVDLEGGRTHYIEKGEGEPLILIHGYFYDSYLWNENIDALAQNFKVYALDLWGFGYSARGDFDFGYQLFADQVLQFMDSLGIQKASIAGQSMGGGTAILFTVQNRDRVNKLVLVDAAGLPNPVPPVGKIMCIPGVGEFFLWLPTNLIRTMFIESIFIHKKNLLTPAYFKGVTWFHKIKGTTSSLLTVLRNDFFGTLTDEINTLATLNVPTLIVWGREDQSVSLPHGQQMHQILTGSQFEILDDAGHVSNFDDSATFNQLAVTFLKE